MSQAPELLLQIQPLADGRFEVSEVRSGDLLDALGLQKDDIIQTVNGGRPDASLSLSEAIRQALQQTQEPMRLRLQIERNGQPSTVRALVVP